MRGTHRHHILGTAMKRWGDEGTLSILDSHQWVQIKNSVNFLITIFIIQVVCEVDGVASEPQLTGLSVEPAALRLREDGAHTKIRNTGKQ
jgi:hypothetical protein